MKVVINLILDDSYTDQEINMRLAALGELIIQRVMQNVRQYDLISDGPGKGQYLQGWISKVENDELIIDNVTPYAKYLEYGTYSYFDQYGLDDFPDEPIKKKDLSPDARQGLPKGMAPFAVCRRVIYNEEIMIKLIVEAFS